MKAKKKDTATKQPGKILTAMKALAGIVKEQENTLKLAKQKAEKKRLAADNANTEADKQKSNLQALKSILGDPAIYKAVKRADISINRRRKVAESDPLLLPAAKTEAEAVKTATPKALPKGKAAATATAAASKKTKEETFTDKLEAKHAAARKIARRVLRRQTAIKMRQARKRNTTVEENGSTYKVKIKKDFRNNEYQKKVLVLKVGQHAKMKYLNKHKIYISGGHINIDYPKTKDNYNYRVTLYAGRKYGGEGFYSAGYSSDSGYNYKLQDKVHKTLEEAIERLLKSIKQNNPEHYAKVYSDTTAAELASYMKIVGNSITLK